MASKTLFKLERYTPHEVKNYSGNRIEIAKDKEHARSFVKDAKSGGCKGKKLLLGKIGKDLAQKIRKETNVDLTGFNLELRANDIRHLFKEHGNASTEALRGQRAVTIDDVLNFADIIQDFDKAEAIENKRLRFVKNADGKTTAITLYATGNKSLSLKTMWVNKKRDLSQAANAQKSLRQNVQNDLGTVSANNIQKSKAKKTGGKAMGKGKKEKAGSLFGQVSAPKGKKPIAEVAARLLTHFKRGDNDWVSMEPGYPQGICVKKEKGYYYLDVIGTKLPKLSFAMRAPAKLISDGHVFWETTFECVGSPSSCNGPDRKGAVCIVSTREPIRDILKRNKKAILHKDEGIPLPKAPLVKSWPIPDISKTNIFKTSAEGESEEAKPIPARLVIKKFDGNTKKNIIFEPKDIANFSLEKIDGRNYLRAGKTLVELSPLTFGVGSCAENKNGPTLSVFLQQDPRNLELRIYLRKPAASVDFSKKNNFKIDKSISLDLSVWRKNNV